MKRQSCLLLALMLATLMVPLVSAQNMTTIGYTQYDLQSIGSSGRRIAVDILGGVHFTWMNGNPYPAIRQVIYARICSDGFSYENASNRNGDGFPQLDIYNGPLMPIVYHNARGVNAESLFCQVDQNYCEGPWGLFHPPNRIGDLGFMWPYFTVDHNNRFHIVTTAANGGNAFVPFAYTRSNDGGTTWTALEIVDTVRTISPIIVSSKVSDKVAVIYTHSDSAELKNNVYYVESTDGINWNGFLQKHNITDYGHGGNRWAWTEVSALYDYNDNLHIIWNAQEISYVPNPHYIVQGAHLYHYDAASGSTHAFAQPPDVWPDSGCEFGHYNFIFAKFSIAADLANNLYVAYTSWRQEDCSASGFANGDIFLQYSTDNGVSWAPDIMLTNTPTPGCVPGDCDSEHWSSLAEVADTAIHLFYVLDKDAGGIPYSEGLITDNPMIYMSYSDNLPLTSIQDDISKPKAFTLSQNYPNPFNAQTTIKYSLKEKTEITISIYNIVGERLTTLLRETQSVGEHLAVWDASRFSSGIYFAKLESEGKSESVRMVLLK